MLIDNNFKAWVQEISKEYKRSQIKAAIKVNGELIKFYFKLGGEIANTSYKKQYGNSFYQTLSNELISNLEENKQFDKKNQNEYISDVNSNLEHLFKNRNKNIIEKLLLRYIQEHLNYYSTD